MGILDFIADIVSELMGCDPDAADYEDCRKSAEKTARNIFYGAVAIIALIVGLRLYKMFK